MEGDDERLPSSRAPWIILGIGALAAAGVIVGWLVLRETLVPHRVLVVTRGCGEPCEEDLRTRLTSHLSGYGFDVVPPMGEPASGAATIDEALEEAAARDARYVAYLEVEVVGEREGLEGGRRFVTAEARAQVQSVDPDEPEGPVHALRFGAEGSDTADALRKMMRPWSNVHFENIAADLLAQPHLNETLESGAGLDELTVRSELDRGLTELAGRRRTDARRRELCNEADRSLAADRDRGAGTVACLSGGCDEHYAFGVTPDAASVLLHVESPTIFVPLGSSPAPRSAETVERLELRPVGGGEPRVLAEANNFYGYGDLSRDGRTAVFVEQGADSTLGLVALDLESGERRVLHLVRGRTRLLQPRFSPDGHSLLFWQQASRRSPSIPYVVAASGGGAAPVARDVDGAWWVEHDGESALVIRDAGTGGVTLLDAGLDAAARLDPAGRRVADVAGGRDGSVLVTWSLGRDCGIGRWAPSTGETEWHPTAACISDPTLAPDGTIVGTAVTTREGDPDPGDPELVRVDPASGEITVLTVNALRERYARVPPTGNRIFFERLGESQFRAVHNAAVCWIDVPAVSAR